MVKRKTNSENSSMIREAEGAGVKKPGLTPKAIIHQKFGVKACYRIEEVKKEVDNACPGLAIAQQCTSLYRCHLELPDLSVVSDAFTRKKDAEQAAAKVAIEKLGIETANDNLSPEEAWTELVARVAGFFKDEFLSSAHPLNGHFRAVFRCHREHFGMIPISAIAACDLKVNNLCKIICSGADPDPLLVPLLTFYAAKISNSVCTKDGELWIWKREQHSVDSVISNSLEFSESIKATVVRIPCLIEDNAEALTIEVLGDDYYMDRIAEMLNVKDSSHILVSRTVGKASSETKLYFPLLELSLLPEFSLDKLANLEEHVKLGMLNERASYLAGQRIFGDAILANIGYTWKSADLFHEDVSLCAYHRMLLGKLPNGHYKLSRGAILGAELPYSYNGRINWKGPTPKELLSVFCRQHRLSEPHFNVIDLDSLDIPLASPEMHKKSNSLKSKTEVTGENCAAASVGKKQLDNAKIFKCEVKIFSKKQKELIEFSLAETYKKESDAIQCSALKVISWFDKYFKQQDLTLDQLSHLGDVLGIRLNLDIFSQEFLACKKIHGREHSQHLTKYSLESFCENHPNRTLENGMVMLNIEGPESGVFPSPGSLICISYNVALVSMEDSTKDQLESIDEFEFEMGNGAVTNQLEACVAQLSINQAACFVTDIPSVDLVLAAATESSKLLSTLCLNNSFLEYWIKLLRVTEPLEDRMEQAFFSPPLSKQRLEFAVGHINNSQATSLIDFGCGSGSLLDSLIDQETTLHTIVGVDISRKGLARAAKSLHQKLSQNSFLQANIRSLTLYDGSITNFDCRLYGFDIGTCLEVIEHMEEDQACLFGDVVLSNFCPRILIVSTPNYEYNSILQRSSATDKEEEVEEKTGPCKFRNHDHKFEWTRVQFQQWATDLALRHNYDVAFSGVGGTGDEPGFASQIAVFRRNLPCLPGKSYSENAEASKPFEIVWEWGSKLETSG